MDPCTTYVLRYGCFGNLELNGERYRVIGVLPEDFEPLRMTNPAEVPQVFALAAYSPLQRGGVPLGGGRSSAAFTDPQPVAAS
jgi:hypothetical protein